MLRQLAENPDNGCEPLGRQGARGALFRLTLESYGYVFVAKGTVTAFKAKLKHEGLVYQHLHEVQGALIPVYLGNISLVRPHFLDVGVRIVHMLLMSWAGEQARKDLMSAMGRDLASETSGAVKKMLDCGVEHRDVRPPNVLIPRSQMWRWWILSGQRSSSKGQSFKRDRQTGSGSTLTLTLRRPVEVFLTDFLLTQASALIGAIHMFR
jgi:hypothetical protein